MPAGRLVVLRSEVPYHAADRRQQQDEANDAPYDGSTRWTIADEFFVRPILCVGDVLARTIRARRPCSPPEERRHLALLGDIG